MTKTSLYSQGLHRHQIIIQQVALKIDYMDVQPANLREAVHPIIHKDQCEAEVGANYQLPGNTSYSVQHAVQFREKRKVTTG